MQAGLRFCCLKTGLLTSRPIYETHQELTLLLYVINIGTEGAQWLSGRVLDSRLRVQASLASLRCGP